MGFRLAVEYVEAVLADRNISDEDREVLTLRAERARAWLSLCRERRDLLPRELAILLPWKRIGRNFNPRVVSSNRSAVG